MLLLLLRRRLVCKLVEVAGLLWGGSRGMRRGGFGAGEEELVWLGR